MSAKGCYELQLECDHSKPEVCGKRETFIDTTRMEALATARYDGWLISRDKKTFCPEHAEIRRASWR